MPGGPTFLLSSVLKKWSGEMPEFFQQKSETPLRASNIDVFARPKLARDLH
jgi:hypothetical protein